MFMRDHNFPKCALLILLVIVVSMAIPLIANSASVSSSGTYLVMRVVKLKEFKYWVNIAWANGILVVYCFDKDNMVLHVALVDPETGAKKSYKVKYYLKYIDSTEHSFKDSLAFGDRVVYFIPNSSKLLVMSMKGVHDVNISSLGITGVYGASCLGKGRIALVYTTKNTPSNSWEVGILDINGKPSLQHVARVTASWAIRFRGSLVAVGNTIIDLSTGKAWKTPSLAVGANLVVAILSDKLVITVDAPSYMTLTVYDFKESKTLGVIHSKDLGAGIFGKNDILPVDSSNFLVRVSGGKYVTFLAKITSSGLRVLRLIDSRILSIANKTYVVYTADYNFRAYISRVDISGRVRVTPFTLIETSKPSYICSALLVGRYAFLEEYSPLGGYPSIIIMKYREGVNTPKLEGLQDEWKVLKVEDGKAIVRVSITGRLGALQSGITKVMMQVAIYERDTGKRVKYWEDSVDISDGKFSWSRTTTLPTGREYSVNATVIACAETPTNTPKALHQYLLGTYTLSSLHKLKPAVNPAKTQLTSSPTQYNTTTTKKLTTSSTSTSKSTTIEKPVKASTTKQITTGTAPPPSRIPMIAVLVIATVIALAALIVVVLKR